MGWIHGGDEWHEDGRGESASAAAERLEALYRAKEREARREREARALKAAHDALEKATARTLPTFENVEDLRKVLGVFRSAAKAHPEFEDGLQEAVFAGMEAYNAFNTHGVDADEWILVPFYLQFRIGEGDWETDCGGRAMTRRKAESELREAEEMGVRLVKMGLSPRTYRIVTVIVTVEEL